MSGAAAGSGLEAGGLPDPAANIGEDVLQFKLCLRLCPSLVWAAEGDVLALTVGPEAQRKYAPIGVLADHDLAGCWSGHA